MRTRTARRTVRVWPRTSRIVTVTVVLSVRTPRARRRRSVVLRMLSANVRRAGPAESRRVTCARRGADSPRRRAVARDTVIVAVARHATAQPTVNVARSRVREAAIVAVGRDSAPPGLVPPPGAGVVAGVVPGAGVPGACACGTTVTVVDVMNVRPPRKSVAPTRGWNVPGVGYVVRRTGVTVLWSKTPSPFTSQLYVRIALSGSRICDASSVTTWPATAVPGVANSGPDGATLPGRAPRTSNSERSTKRAPAPPGAGFIGDSSVTRTKRTPAAAPVGATSCSAPTSPGANVCVSAGLNVVPSLETSTEMSFVAELGSSPQLFDGSMPNAVTSTASGSWTVTVGGTPGCVFGIEVLFALNADQPTPVAWSNACATPQPKSANTLSLVVTIDAPPARPAQSRRIAAFTTLVAPARIVTGALNVS